ncbi:alpha-glucosidase C-terminal domain-containing protein [Caldicoprobacter algeriensis]|uniref:alpha-amylase family glycosyl hydrolase n=1 Tax=Caldicoprobacter algeriensis TaxID=699281 RepID=UPI00207AAA05|nr:alpha-amylase family glycosyl hydrolase [Caldicoprobacter algeriensis]MCM8901466.1 alpha-glucosidase C-terminal domain-containing protein [Caldicoprobacter algeriensis]
MPEERMMRRDMRKQWWEQCLGIMRFMPKVNSQTIRDIIKCLDEVKEWGFDAIEIFAPYHGGKEYGGLDVYNYYSIDPAIGTMDDFLELIRISHEKELAIIIFINMGYCAMDCPAFLKACRDIKAGINSTESRWFLWSDTGTEKLDKSLAPYFMNDTDGHWCYNEEAGKYYWVKWNGIHGDVELPQFNFGDPGWQEECSKVLKFWLETGIDGMILDAVNWYLNCNWEINKRVITDAIRQYPNQYIQPEGAGGFNDDSVLWITEGGYNSVQDYGLSIWWSGHDVIGEAIQSGDPSGIEEALRRYRDRVVAARGVTYLGPYWNKEVSNEQRLLEIATIATVGELFHADSRLLNLAWPEEDVHKAKSIIRALQSYPALQTAGSRRRLRTNDDSKYYAFIRTSKDGLQSVLVVLNFQKVSADINVELDTSLILKDVFTNREIRVSKNAQISLPPYGYGIYLITS